VRPDDGRARRSVGASVHPSTRDATLRDPGRRFAWVRSLCRHACIVSYINRFYDHSVGHDPRVRRDRRRHAPSMRAARATRSLARRHSAARTNAEAGRARPDGRARGQMRAIQPALRDAPRTTRGARATTTSTSSARRKMASAARRGRAVKAHHGGAGGDHGSTDNDNGSSAPHAWNSQQVVESLAKTFLGGSTAGAASRRDISTRAWLCDLSDEATTDEECATSRRTIIKAREMEVKNGVLRSSPRPSGAAFLKELELYATLRRHESAVVVAKLKRPTILTDETSGESVAFVDAEDLAMDDDERNENDALLSNYCLTCPLRSGDEEPSMCGFECAIRSRIEARSKAPLTTYRAAVFSTKAGDLEEFLITSTSSGSHTTRRAQFSNALREKLGINHRSLV